MGILQTDLDNFGETRVSIADAHSTTSDVPGSITDSQQGYGEFDSAPTVTHATFTEVLPHVVVFEESEIGGEPPRSDIMSDPALSLAPSGEVDTVPNNVHAASTHAVLPDVSTGSDMSVPQSLDFGDVVTASDMFPAPQRGPSGIRYCSL